MLNLTPSASWLPVSLLTLTLTYLLVQWKRQRQVKGSPFDVDYVKLSGVPPPRPLLDFDIDDARPRPYRPFRWKYFQTMALSPLEPDWWIELESTYRERVKQRQELYAKHGRGILDALPGSESACKELMAMVIQFLCARYPRLFSFDKSTVVFTNGILTTTTNVDRVDPLHFLLDNVPEDFLITQKDPQTGLYHLRAAVSCSQVGWDLREKMGRPMHAIHRPVPDYSGFLKPSVDKFFDRMPVEKPIQRASWTFEIGQPLYLQADDPAFQEHKQFKPDLNIDDVHLRVDWQTLRRLPQSQAIVFNFKALFTPVTHFQEEPYIPQLVLKVLGEAKLSIREYKGWSHLEHKLIPALEGWAKDQVERRLVPDDWEERTLDEHPFYPGWKNT